MTTEREELKNMAEGVLRGRYSTQLNGKIFAQALLDAYAWGDGLRKALIDTSYLREGICWCADYPEDSHSSDCEQALKAILQGKEPK